MGMLASQQTIEPADLDRGVRNLMWDATFATAIGALNSGVVLLALAIHLGASNVQIGILAAVPLITQVLQAPAVAAVERLRARRRISVVSLFVARLALPVYALVPLLDDRQVAISILIVAAFVHYGLNACGACSWNSWIRDLIPAERLGQFFARRSLYATAVTAGCAVLAALALEAASRSAELGDRIFSGLYVFGFLCGIISSVALARVPEPAMPPRQAQVSLRGLLVEPLRDRNFRNMLRFLASWQFAVNLATPFFTVFFVRGLGFSLGFVMVLTLVSQLATFAVLRGWGRLSDRFANKSVLSVATPLYLVCIVLLVLADEFDSRVAQASFLIGLHVVLGFASAGVGLASGNIAMKLSPAGSATSYMATNALVSAVAAGIAPIVGGWAVDFFADRYLRLEATWTSPAGVAEVAALGLTNWEFFFLLAPLIGLYTLHRLAAIDEQGAVERRELVQHMWVAARRTLLNASTVAGLRLGVSFPGGELLTSRQKPARPRRRKRAATAD